MAKTLLTQKIESVLKVWHPANYGEYQVDSFRQGFDALEVPVECGSIKIRPCSPIQNWNISNVTSRTDMFTNAPCGDIFASAA